MLSGPQLRIAGASPAAVSFCGCPWSRWALKDPDYAAKYDAPAEALDVATQAKQSVDARFVEGESGWYVAGAGHAEPDAAGGEIGGFIYPQSCVYPEIGVHYWLNSSVRATASGAYYVTTEGRDSDFWFYGASLSFLQN